MELPKTFEEYEASVKKRLNWVERLTKSLTSTDERTDITNGLLIELLKTQVEVIRLLGEKKEVKTYPEFYYSKIPVSTEIVRVKDDVYPLQQGVAIKADNDNTGSIYVGREDVTSSDGFRLEAGEAIMIEIDDLSKVYVVGSASGQNFYWMGV